MKCLVTGGAGFIGSNLVDQLVKEGHEVQVWDDLSTGDEYNVNPKAVLHRCSIIGSYQAREVLIKEFNPDVIFHLAALARIQPSFDDPIKTADVNVNGTYTMCELARVVGARIVYAGSSSFYAGPHLNPYSFTKWQGEEVCKLYSEVYGVSTAIARFFNVFGPRHLTEGAYATVVGIFERQYKNNEPLTITWDGEQRRDFTHVNNIVRGLIKMSEEEWGGEIFNLGTSTNHSINELATMYNHRTTYIPKRPGEARNTLADLSFSEEKLDYKPIETIEEYVAEWLEENKR